MTNSGSDDHRHQKPSPWFSIAALLIISFTLLAFTWMVIQ